MLLRGLPRPPLPRWVGHLGWAAAHIGTVRHDLRNEGTPQMPPLAKGHGHPSGPINNLLSEGAVGRWATGGTVSLLPGATAPALLKTTVAVNSTTLAASAEAGLLATEAAVTAAATNAAAQVAATGAAAYSGAKMAVDNYMN